MTKKIFKSIVSVSIIVFAISLALITSVLYKYFSNQQIEKLTSQMKLIAYGVELDGENYLKSLNYIDYRITWIDDDGKVLFDNTTSANKMSNHWDREEFQEAYKGEIGISSRYSSTLTKQLFYVAMKIKDGTVIRLSDSYNTPWILVLQMLQPIVIILIILLILAFVFATRISKKITAPLDEIDLDNPMASNSYPELEPFLDKISNQEIKIKNQEIELLEKEKLSDKLEEKRREFTSNVSHELKTPIQTISGYSELLKSGMVPKQDVESIGKTIYKESKRLNDLINDVIGLANLEEGANTVVKELIDIDEIINENISLLANKINEKNIELIINHEHSIVNQPSRLVNGIVYNLIDNAIKYNKEFGKIIISIFDKEDKSIIIFEDTGIGIPEESLENIFERFYRVDKSRSREIGGTGLGLSIVKHSVEMCNGSISVESKLAEGSKFTVEISK